MTRNQLGRMIQLDKEGWTQVPDTTEPGMDALMGGPATMTRAGQTIVVDNDGSVLVTSETPLRMALPAFDVDTDQPDQPSGLLMA